MNPFFVADSLFDFDFELENLAAKYGRVNITTGESPRPMADPAPEVNELPEVILSTIERLKEMAFRALDENRMEAYFRLIEERERWEDAAKALELDGWDFSQANLILANERYERINDYVA